MTTNIVPVSLGRTRQRVRDNGATDRTRTAWRTGPRNDRARGTWCVVAGRLRSATGTAESALTSTALLLSYCTPTPFRFSLSLSLSLSLSSSGICRTERPESRLISVSECATGTPAKRVGAKGGAAGPAGAGAWGQLGPPTGPPGEMYCFDRILCLVKRRQSMCAAGCVHLIYFAICLESNN